MKKNAKAAIAVAAGVLLLLGGGGSLALWNSTADTTGGTIAAGQLKVDSTTATTDWYTKANWDAHAANGSVALVPLDASYTIVPGDDLVLAVDGVDLTAQGGDLYYTLGLTNGSVTVTESDGTTVPSDAAAALSALTVTTLDVANTFSTKASSGSFTDGTNTLDATTDTIYHVVGSDNVQSSTVTVAVEVAFSANNEDFQSYIYKIGNAALNIQQVVKS